MGDFAVRIEVFAAMMLAATILVAVAGQQQVPSCAEKLVPCANYIASQKPPESCCGPVKEAVKDELPCLCSLFNNPQLIAAFSINLTQALQLPKKCGIQSSKPLCNSTSTSTPISPAKGSPVPSQSTTPTSPSSNTINPVVYLQPDRHISSAFKSQVRTTFSDITSVERELLGEEDDSDFEPVKKNSTKVRSFIEDAGSALPPNMLDWKIEPVEGIPKQRNGIDCGVFVLKFMEAALSTSEIAWEKK